MDQIHENIDKKRKKYFPDEKTGEVRNVDGKRILHIDSRTYIDSNGVKHEEWI